MLNLEFFLFMSKIFCTFVIMVKIGTTRIVFLLKNHVVKIPNFKYQHDHFLKGCSASWYERKLSKQFKDCEKLGIYKKIAPTLWCSWFGLVSIQKRVKPLYRHLTEDEVEYFREITEDNKYQNFGFLDGELVCVDYG